MLSAMLLLSAAIAGQDVSLKTQDGKTLQASVDLVEDATQGVVLVHMYGRHGGDWQFLSDRLSRSKVDAVSPTLRGHGEEMLDEIDDYTEEDYQAMLFDVQAAIGYLRSRGHESVSCIGAGLGANICLAAAAVDPQIVNMVLLSPGLNIRGFNSVTGIRSYGKRPVLLVASLEDKYGSRTVMLLDERAQGQHHLELLDKAGAGTKMLNRDPSLEGLVLSWILGTFELADGESVSPRPATESEISEIETTGKKLDIHK